VPSPRGKTIEADALINQAPPAIPALYSGLIDKLRRAVGQAAKGAVGAELVADAVEHAMTSAKPRTPYPVGKDAKMRLLLMRLPDRMIDRLILNRLNSM
jgi:hypothetical protein